MRPGLRALLLSSASHLLLLGGGVVAAGFMHPPSPILPIDLTQFSDGGGGGGSDLGQPSPDVGAAVSAVPPPVSSAIPNPPDAMDQPDVLSAPPVLSTSADAAPIAASPEVPPDFAPSLVGAKAGPGKGGGLGLGSGTGKGQGSGMGSGLGSGQGSGIGSGHGDGLDVLRAMYLREHFAYIRDRIARHLVYPPCAIRAGWGGRVLVSFVVTEDGRVDGLGIQRGSGISLLDRDAQDTVRRAAPFPRPPVRARLVIPVEYTLE